MNEYITKVGIRVDGNNQIASGHVMRCLAIADALRRQSAEIFFFSADHYFEYLIRQHSFLFFCLNSQWDDLEQEIIPFQAKLIEYQIEKLLIDSYYVTNRYIEVMREIVPIIYLDDLHQSIYPVNILINSSLGYKVFDYSKYYDEKQTKLLLGCSYIPLRKEFENVPPREKKKCRNILITTGASDHFNMILCLLSEFMKSSFFADIVFHVVIGKFYSKKDELSQFVQVHNQIILYENVTNMAEIMMQCDLAVTAGGTTVFELCACSVPCICFGFADNQLENLETLDRANIIDSVGDIRTDREKAIKGILSRLIHYMNNPKDAAAMAERMQRLVDGKGAMRIASEIIRL